MQNRQSGRRRRGGGNTPRPMGMASAGGGNNSRLEGRVRGNAHQLLEKYKVMARDAHQAGDRVAAEYYLQHADHYFRVLNDSRIRQEEMRARRSAFDPLDDEQDMDEGGDEAELRQERPDRAERREQPARRERLERAERGERPRRERGEEPARRERADEERAGGGRADDERDGLSDGEAALAAFGGVPGGVNGGAAAEDAPAPAPRRRGRPRKVVADVADAGGGAEPAPVSDG